MDILRTAEERFANLSGFDHVPRYLNDLPGYAGLRMHYVDEGPRDAEVFLCLHGEPTWSFLYRRMIPVFTGAGFRVIAPDLFGFGRSDKPTERADYTYARHVAWIRAFLDAAGLRDGLNLVAKEGVALNTADGVLVLSTEAGAWAELGDDARERSVVVVRQPRMHPNARAHRKLRARGRTLRARGWWARSCAARPRKH